MRTPLLRPSGPSHPLRWPLSRQALRSAALCAALFLAACTTPPTERFARVQPGMTQAEVEQILGPPSSRTQVPADRQATLGYRERWQFGDSLSSLASGAVFHDAPDDRVFAVFFDDDGRVLRTQEPLSGPRRTVTQP